MLQPAQYLVTQTASRSCGSVDRSIHPKDQDIQDFHAQDVTAI